MRRISTNSSGKTTSLGWARRHLTWRVTVIALVLAVELLLVLITTCVDPQTRYAWKKWATGGMKAATGNEPTAPGGKKIVRRVADVPMAYLGEGRVDLGRYRIEIFNPLTASTMHTDFRLKAMTTFGSEDEFQRFIDCNRQFLREQVTVAVRMCRFGELATPDLELLGKKLVSRVNRVIGQPLLKSADINEYQSVELIENASLEPITAGSQADQSMGIEFAF